MWVKGGYKKGNRLIDLKGRIFGHLLVKKIDITKSSRISNGHMANAYWRCKCDLCGCIVSVRSDHLRKGDTRMCGSCASDARIHFFERMRKIHEIIHGPAPEAKPEKTRLVLRKVLPGTNPKKMIMNKSFSQANAVKQVKSLRESNMSISDIMDLLTLSREEVLAEIKRYKSE